MRRTFLEASRHLRWPGHENTAPNQPISRGIDNEAACACCRRPADTPTAQHVHLVGSRTVDTSASTTAPSTGERCATLSAHYNGRRSTAVEITWSLRRQLQGAAQHSPATITASVPNAGRMLRLAGTPHMCFTQLARKRLMYEVVHACTADLKTKLALQQRPLSRLSGVLCQKCILLDAELAKMYPPFLKTCQPEQNRRWTS